MNQSTAIQLRFGKVEEGSMGFVGISDMGQQIRS